MKIEILPEPISTDNSTLLKFKGSVCRTLDPYMCYYLDQKLTTEDVIEFIRWMNYTGKNKEILEEHNRYELRITYSSINKIVYEIESENNLTDPINTVLNKSAAYIIKIDPAVGDYTVVSKQEFDQRFIVLPDDMLRESKPKVRKKTSNTKVTK